MTYIYCPTYFNCPSGCAPTLPFLPLRGFSISSLLPYEDTVLVLELMLVLELALVFELALVLEKALVFELALVLELVERSRL